MLETPRELDICRICLRPDVPLKEIDKYKNLVLYFESLTDFRLFQVDTRLCFQCEYLLRKCYNFKKKCEIASKVLQKWMCNRVSQEKSDMPLEVLYKEVPQLPLNIYHQDNSTIFQYYHSYEQSQDKYIDLKLDKSTKEIVKQETDCTPSEIYLKDHSTVAVKVENVTESFQEILFSNSNIAETDADIVLVNENGMQINKYNSENNLNDCEGDINYISESNDLSSDDECLADKLLRGNAQKQNNVCTEFDNLSETYLSDENRHSDIDDDETLKETEINIINKLKTIDKDLNAIYKNWRKTSLSDFPEIFLKINKTNSMIRKKMIERDDSTKKKKDAALKLVDLSCDLDIIKENCLKLIDYKEGLMNPKESLRSELTAKFSTCGELKTESGYVINKDTILSCFDRISECLMRRLWRFIHGKATLESRAINTLKHIQNKYQNEHQYEAVFHIEYLNTKEKVAEEFERRKTYSWYINAKYKCEMCYLGFKYEAQMENHKHSHEESAGDFACGTCGVRLTSKKSLDTHSKSHEAVYKCKLCPLITYYKYSMVNHYHQHKGLEYRCEQCDTTFKSKSAYKTHVGVRHTEGAHACAVCGRALATSRALHWHMARAHARGPQTARASEPVSCPTCAQQFVSQHAYLRHARSKHATAATENGKEGVPKKKPVHKCRVCNAVGHSVGWLSLHFRGSHPALDMALVYADKQLHLCDICGKGYANQYNLRDHLATHAGVRAHACATCGARFHRAASLAQHAATHAPPRRPCPRCGKVFRSHSNLNNHMRGHIGDRRYKCAACGKGFLHRNALNEHVRGVHHKLRRVRAKHAHAHETPHSTDGGQGT